jgi:hydroxymethylglutaryl-CoA lyase
MIAVRAIIAEGLPGEPIYGNVPDAGLPKSFVYAARERSGNSQLRG